jgi:hypothetical protein
VDFLLSPFSLLRHAPAALAVVALGLAGTALWRTHEMDAARAAAERASERAHAFQLGRFAVRLGYYTNLPEGLREAAFGRSEFELAAASAYFASFPLPFDLSTYGWAGDDGESGWTSGTTLGSAIRGYLGDEAADAYEIGRMVAALGICRSEPPDVAAGMEPRCAELAPAAAGAVAALDVPATGLVPYDIDSVSTYLEADVGRAIAAGGEG